MRPLNPQQTNGTQKTGPPWSLWAATALAALLLAAVPALAAPPNVVVNTADSGAGSLRDALTFAAANPGTTVQFNIPPLTNGNPTPGFDGKAFTIKPKSALPVLTANSTVVDGTSQTAFSGDTNPNGPEVELNGVGAGINTGLDITAAKCTVKGLAIGGFSLGIEVHGGSAVTNKVQRCYVGLHAWGGGVLPNSDGIVVDTGARGTIIGGADPLTRNVISGNSANGVNITGPGTNGNSVLGNYVGTDPTGLLKRKNGNGGVIVTGGAQNNSIGGPAKGAGNVISANGFMGILFEDAGTTANTASTNFIGTDKNGTAALPNHVGALLQATNGCTVSNNVISGNLDEGVLINDATSGHNLVSQNIIGLNRTGNAALGNGSHGVEVQGTATVVIGNVISANGDRGVLVIGPGTVSNRVQGNIIGLDSAGSMPLSNAHHGVELAGGAHGNLIGGGGPNEGNTISSNLWAGVALDGPKTFGNDVQGNFIGTDIGGAVQLGNGFQGVWIFGGAQGNTIGGTFPGDANVIAANGKDGVALSEGAHGNALQGNFIGTDKTGTLSLFNNGAGVRIESPAGGPGTKNNLIGGANPGAGNRIAFNKSDGVLVKDAGTEGITIRGNFIYENSGLGINLAKALEPANAPTSNDIGDPDSGPNALQNYPVFTLTNSTGSSTTLAGTLNSTPNASFIIDLYASPAADPSGFGEGKVYVGSVTISTNAAGNGTFSLTVGQNYASQFATATATRAGTGDTSEFGRDARVMGAAG
jgi:hypothetical protein